MESSWNHHHHGIIISFIPSFFPFARPSFLTAFFFVFFVCFFFATRPALPTFNPNPSPSFTEQKARKHAAEAQELQKSARRKKMCICFWLLFIVGIIVLIAMLTR
jgi:hypothetical protein